ncbi:unnamed protein product [Lathyrus oleraceus]|uniref:proteinase inhibitor PSI-1.2 n=1 Tax=Pisum sativum TaxID=3888 RepID=UPI001FC4C46A|nr:proteinase inhibitor PSI-1.2-like [Pisum sativum]
MALKIETIFLVFVYGAILLGGNLKSVDAKVCPLICYDSAAYMICPSDGNQHLTPPCNCCLASPGCKLYQGDGTLICTAT